MDSMLGAKYCITTVVPYAEHPEVRKYELGVDELRKFCSNLNEVAECIIEIKAKESK